MLINSFSPGLNTPRMMSFLSLSYPLNAEFCRGASASKVLFPQTVLAIIPKAPAGEKQWTNEKIVAEKQKCRHFIFMAIFSVTPAQIHVMTGRRHQPFLARTLP
ncbi:hypothetical protein [Pseudomonas sp. TE21394]